jgi:hypothetical protein
MNEQVFNETIRALQLVRGTALIGLTTPRGVDNFVTTLAQMKNDDLTPFHNVIHKTTICEVCKQLPFEQMVKCDHVRLPSWKSMEKQKQNAEVAKNLGTIGTTAQEDCGIILENVDGGWFSKTLLNIHFDINDRNKTFPAGYVPQRIFIMCDPNSNPAPGNIKASRTAVTSCFWAPPENVGGKNRFVMLSLDLILNSKTTEKHALVISVTKKIRGMFPTVPIIYVPENNSGHAEKLEDIVEDLSSVITLRQEGKEKDGICKDRDITAFYVATFDGILNSGQLFWHRDFFTLSEQEANLKRGLTRSTKTDRELLVEEYKIQMGRMKRLPGGKISGKEGGNNDDGAIAMMMAPYWSRAVNNPANAHYQYYRDLVCINRGDAIASGMYNGSKQQRREEYF